MSDGSRVRTAAGWVERRKEIRDFWMRELGPWPNSIKHPKTEYLSSTNREGVIQHEITLEIAPGQNSRALLLVPSSKGPHPAVVVPFYDPETSVGSGKAKLRDFGWQLARRGFVTLSIGSPGGDARKPDIGAAACQPLSFLAYVAENCAQALALLPEVDPQRIGIVGHSYGGKWALFAAALSDKFACAAFSDPGIVFDESRPNVNYWEPWYLGLEKGRSRKPGLPTESNPRTGAYKRLYEKGHDLHELMALIAPRPFLVSGGAEDPPERWQALNRVLEVYAVLGQTNRVAMTNREGHSPTPESNEQIYSFFEEFLKPKR